MLLLYLRTPGFTPLTSRRIRGASSLLIAASTLILGCSTARTHAVQEIPDNPDTPFTLPWPQGIARGNMQDSGSLVANFPQAAESKQHHRSHLPHSSVHTVIGSHHGTQSIL